jgi:hypothetical protein
MMYTSKLHTSLLITLDLLHSLHEILGFVLLVGRSAGTPFYSRAAPGYRTASMAPFACVTPRLLQGFKPIYRCVEPTVGGAATYLPCAEIDGSLY